MFVAISIIAWLIVMIFSIIQMLLGASSMLVPKFVEMSFLEKVNDFFSKNILGINKLQTISIQGLVKDFLIPGFIISFGLMFFITSLVELVRIKKKQKISKPFIKGLMVITIVLNLIYGKAIVLPLASALLVSFIMLEMNLFDVDALNNYAEERNLISIYKEEHKFEREVAKEGKIKWTRKYGGYKGNNPTKYKYSGSKWEKDNEH